MVVIRGVTPKKLEKNVKIIRGRLTDPRSSVIVVEYREKTWGQKERNML